MKMSEKSKPSCTIVANAKPLNIFEKKDFKNKRNEIHKQFKR